MAAGTDQNKVPSGGLIGKLRDVLKNDYQQPEQLISLIGAIPMILSGEFGIFDEDEQPPKKITLSGDKK